MFNYERTDYSNMSIEQLGDIRDYALLRLDDVSETLKALVKAEHEEGVEISTLARRAGVSRNTASQWVK